MSDFNTYFRKLHTNIQGYVFFHAPIKECLGSDNIIGIFCCAPSLIRKESCINRVKKEIENLQLPMTVIDEIEFSRYFKILIK